MKNENRPKTVVDFYVLCNKLKNLIRTGWKNWHVQKDRLESVAEHIFGTQILAISMWSQYEYALDINKIIFMLAIHELEEITIGDQTAWDITIDEKRKQGHLAIHEILQELIQKDQLEQLIYEFDARKTPEARFAYYCDKLECDIQAKLYDEAGLVDLSKQDHNPIMKDPKVQQLLTENDSWSSMWLEFGRNKYDYDPNFTEVSHYVETHSITPVEP